MIEYRRMRFADMLEKDPQYIPAKHKLPPMWDLTRVDGGMPQQLRGIASLAHVPTLNWGPKNPDDEVPEGTALVELDANGAFVAAASSATFAHCAPTHTGPLEVPAGQVPAGYLLVDAHPWQYGAPGSPLGANRPRPDADGRIWVPHTVYSVLRDLTYGAKWGAVPGHWPDCTIYDSWTADAVRFDKWAGAVRDVRTEAKITQDDGSSDRAKVAYSQAVQMWNTPPDPKGTPREKQQKKNKAYRPDWYAALRGQHAMNMWRRAYQCTILGRPPLRVWDTDRILMQEHDMLALLARDQQPIPLRLDETGVALGTFKRVRQPNGSTRRYAGIED